MFGFRDISHDVCNVLIHVSGLRSLLSFVYLLRLTTPVHMPYAVSGTALFTCGLKKPFTTPGTVRLRPYMCM